jgi:hypothetical protein
MPSLHDAPNPGCLDEKIPWRNLMAGGLLMPDPPVAPTSLNRLCSPGRLVTNASSPAIALLASVEPAERHDFSRRVISVEGRSECSDPNEGAPNPAPRRSTGASHAQLGVRRPLVRSMPADRRERAISAIADLLIVKLEREAQQPAVDG